MKTAKKSLSVFSLAMLITGSIDSIRNLPATALFGDALIFFFVLSAVVFLIPAALVSAELASTYRKKGGIYHWVTIAFGEKIGLLAIWLQWINTMVWYPTIISFIAGTLAYLINPALATNKVYLVSIVLTVFWTLTLLNLKGLKVSAKFASFCTIVGMVIPMALIIGLAAIWLFSGQPIQLTLSVNHLIPSMHHFQSWISLTAIMTAFLGLELATVHVNEVEQPQHTFPRALLISALIILSTMIFGSLAIAIVLPTQQISLVDGVMQAFTNFFQAYHLSWLTPIIAIMLVIGSLGGMINWIISPAKGLLQAGENGYLPAFFCHKNKNNVPSRILITQAVLVCFVCFAFVLMPSVNGSYWLLTVLSTQLYLMMYVLMFAAMIKMKYQNSKPASGFAIPFGKIGTYGVCALGLIGCITTLVIGFFPPETINVGGHWHYEVVFCSGLALLILPVTLLLLQRKAPVLSFSVTMRSHVEAA